MRESTISTATIEGLLARQLVAKMESQTLSQQVIPEYPQTFLLRPPELLRSNPVAEKLLFAPNLDARLKIVKPFEVQVQRSEGVVTAWIEDINEFGCGSNSSEALCDLGKTLVELFFSLKDNTDRLSPDLRSVWLKLTEHIQSR